MTYKYYDFTYIDKLRYYIRRDFRRRTYIRQFVCWTNCVGFIRSIDHIIIVRRRHHHHQHHHHRQHHARLDDYEYSLHVSHVKLFVHFIQGMCLLYCHCLYYIMVIVWYCVYDVLVTGDGKTETIGDVHFRFRFSPSRHISQWKWKFCHR